MKKIILLIVLISSILTSKLLAQESRLQEHIDFITKNEHLGRKAGSEGEKKIAEYIYEKFSSYGMTMFPSSKSGQDFFIALGQDTIKSLNIVGVVNGYDSLLRDEYIIVGANMDHLGVNVLEKNGKYEEQIFSGANNNASGLAVMLDVAKMVAEVPYLFRRSIVFVGFGAKEQTMAGSWYFLNKAFPYVDKISMMIDLCMLGRYTDNNKFSYFTGIPNQDVSNMVAYMSKNYSVMPPIMLNQTYFSSDFLPFYEKGIPVTLFTTGMNNEYNTFRDTKELLDIDAMDLSVYYIYNFIKEVANLEEPISRVEYNQNVVDKNEVGVYSETDVDKAPTFLKGSVNDFLNEWVYAYLKYPDSAFNNGVQGTILVEFIIDEKGYLTNPKIIRFVDESLENEALRVIKASPKWKPGEIAGRKVKVKYVLPIEFRLKKR